MEKKNDVLNFANKVKEKLQGNYSNYQIDVHEVLKNNETLLAVTIREPESKICPTIYLNELYERYVNEKLTMDEVVLFIRNSHAKALSSKSIKNLDLDMFDDAEKIKEHLIIKAVGTKYNEEYLQDAVYHIALPGIAAAVFVLVNKDENGIACVKLDRKMVSKYGFNLVEIYNIALKNTERLFTATVKSMNEIIGHMADEELREDLSDFPMYIISNDIGLNGATTILYPGKLAEICNKIGIEECFLLPSSIHEFILIPANDELYEGDLCRMVKEINATSMAKQDYLSDFVYKFNAKTEQFEFHAS